MTSPVSERSPSKPPSVELRVRAGRTLVAYGLGVFVACVVGLLTRVVPFLPGLSEISTERLAMGAALGLACVGWGWKLSYDHRHGVVWFALGLVALTFAAMTAQVLAVCLRSDGGVDVVDLAVLGVMLIATGLLFSKLARLRWTVRGEAA